MTIPYYSTTGKVSRKTLNDDIFKEISSLKPNSRLIKQAYLSYLANKRQNLAQTKTRGQIRGSTRKYIRQKGTGRARVGGIRSPIRRGGGVVFGPTGQENYGLKMNKKAKLKALRQALNLKHDAILAVQELPKDSKTRSLDRFFKETLKLDRQVLLVVDNISESLDKATRNLDYADVVQVNYLNVFRVINADHIVFNQAALKHLDGWLGSQKQAAEKQKVEAKS